MAAQMDLAKYLPLPSQWLLVLMHESPLILLRELFHGGKHGSDRVFRGDWSLLTTHVCAYPPDDVMMIVIHQGNWDFLPNRDLVFFNLTQGGRM